MKKIEAKLLIGRLDGMKRGETLVYYTGLTGWMGAADWALLEWFGKAIDEGTHDFTQRASGEGIFEYRVTRRWRKAPARKAVANG